MTLLPAGVKVHLAFGYTDMRKGIDGLAMLVQGVLRQPHQDRILGWDGAVPVHQAT
jgi:IS66 Orf2 like protein